MPSRGFSLIEVMIVLGLFALIGGLGLIISMDTYRGHNFGSERNVLLSTLEKARSQAISNMCFGAGCTDGKKHGVHVTPTGYTIFQGSSWGSRDTAVDEVVALESASVVISGLTDVIFAELEGTASFNPVGSHTITLTDSSGKDSSTVSITSEGRICSDEPAC